MTRKTILMSLAMAAIASSASADIKINLGAAKPETIVTEEMSISDLVAGNKDSLKTDTLKITDNIVVRTPAYPVYYKINFGNPKDVIFLFTAPGEDITVDVTSLVPADARISGSRLMNDISKYNDAVNPILEQAYALGNTADEQTMLQLRNSYQDAIKGFIAANPDSPAVAYAVMQLPDPDEQLAAINAMSESARHSIVYPITNLTKQNIEKAKEMETRQQQLGAGGVMAPDFQLPNPEGKLVSLSQFRGKWVILDFWGSWCRWCIKGFPDLKKAYAEYAGKLEVIGIDCGDTEQAWRDAIKKYELPWVQVYNKQSDDSIDKTYAIQGFPTKIIIDPEGRITDITMGEDPEFYTKLAGLLK